jgi:acetyl esterase/lipase
MVMGRRPNVTTASAPIAAVTVFGLAQSVVTGLVKVPFRRPWQGGQSLADNLGRSVTRQVMRTFMGYSSMLPTEEFRSLELVLDDVCRAVMPPIVRALDVEMAAGEVDRTPGNWYRPRGQAPRGTILYLHGGGYIGTSPTMYAAFNANMARQTGCEVFVADYRLAPEFPFPAGLLDAIGVLEALLDGGVPPERLFLAGDSGGGGLATSLLLDVRAHHLPRPAGLILVSPEVDLNLDEPSVTENAGVDILPWNIPVAPYLHGLDPHNKYVSAIYADLHGFPPTFVTYGDDEMFRDPIRRFVQRLQDDEVPLEVVEEPEMFHVFPFLMPWADASQRVYHAIGRFVRDLLPTLDGGAEGHRETPAADRSPDDATAGEASARD